MQNSAVERLFLAQQRQLMSLGGTSAVTAKRTVGYVGLMTEKGRSATSTIRPSAAKSGHLI
jgi:hypothetical protein